MEISKTTVKGHNKVSHQEVVLMKFFEAVCINFQKYATFSGKAQRSEFWFWILFVVIASMLCNILDEALFPTRVEETVYPLSICFSIITFLPGLAVGSRRLHDVGRSGWWQLLGLTIIGFIPLLWWWAKKGTTDSFTVSSL